MWGIVETLSPLNSLTAVNGLKDLRLRSNLGLQIRPTYKPSSAVKSDGETLLSGKISAINACIDGG